MAIDDMRPHSPIAIIGMAMRLPGGISSPEEFWELLKNGRDGRCRVPPDRYNVDAFHGGGYPGQRVASEYGYFLQDTDLSGFDTSFFSVRGNEAQFSDPQQRLLLEVVWECLESAGQTNSKGSDIGVYVGVFGEDWHNMSHTDKQKPFVLRVLAASDFGIANRISHMYDLRGPSVTTRTACSASLTALHQACQALYSGDCPSAIVAGTSLVLEPSMTLDMSQHSVLSPDGVCRAFDANANGFVRADAINAILIKPLENALRDGDPIRAVIRSTAINSNGGTSHIGSPSPEAQQALIKKAYENAGIDDVSQTPFVECHGTGTPVGDPLEVEAVAKVFGKRGTYIGSVKPNVGHGEGASGLTSIIKAVLSLEHAIIPPNVHYETPNPKIPFDEYKLIVPTKPIPWPKGRAARISVNAFGFGGSNAHAILDSAASWGVTSRSPTDGNFVAKALDMRTKLVQKHVEFKAKEVVDDLTYTLGLRRVHLPYRSFCIYEPVNSPQLNFEVFGKPQAIKAENPRITFVFTGQGAQWAGMMRELTIKSPTFREDIRQMDEVLQRLDQPPNWSLEDLLLSGSDLVTATDISQPVCTAVQIAVVNFLRRCGISPEAVIGHSSGEIAAAYSASAITMPEAIIIAYFRGLATIHVGRTGRMAAVGMNVERATPYLVRGTRIACVNSPRNITISGDPIDVEMTLTAMKADNPDLFTRMLNIDVAYHSEHMLEVSRLYEELIKPHLSQPQLDTSSIRYYSSVTGKKASEITSFGAAYWRENLENPVLFYPAMQCLLRDGGSIATIIIEIGPHAALQAPLNHIIREHGSPSVPLYVATARRFQDSVISIIKATGQVFVAGHSINFSFLNPKAEILTDLPCYPWDRISGCWAESRVSRAWRQRKHLHHELLGSRCLESSEHQPIWRNVLHHSDIPWLEDHKIGQNVVFPAAGCIALLGEAIRQARNCEGYELRDLVIKSALLFPDNSNVEILTSMKPAQLTSFTHSTWFDLSITAFNGSGWIETCTAQGRESTSSSSGTKKFVDYPRRVSSARLYQKFHSMGLSLGPRFQTLSNISAHVHELAATASLRNQPSVPSANYPIHPTAIDGCMTIFAVATVNGIHRKIVEMQLPSEIRSVIVNPANSPLIGNATCNAAKTVNAVMAVAKDTQQCAIEMRNVKTIPFDIGDRDHTANELNGLEIARLYWNLDTDTNLAVDNLLARSQPKTALLSAIENVCAVAILRTLDILDSMEVALSDYAARHVLWLQQQRDFMRWGRRDMVLPAAQDWASVDRLQRESLLQSLLADVYAMGDEQASYCGELISKTASREYIEATFKTEPDLDLLRAREEECSEMEHFFLDMVDSDKFFQACAHTKPSLEVLELGGKMGDQTKRILQSLKPETGVRFRYKYTFAAKYTVESALERLQTSTKEAFQGWGNLDYQTLDIETNPLEQGFQPSSFDLIIAASTIYTTSSLQNTLRNIRLLLRPGGHLYLRLPVTPVNWQWIQFLLGFTPAWWVGENDGRVDSIHISKERWNLELKMAGFSGTDTMVMDDDDTHYLCAHIISKACAPLDSITPHVSMLYNTEKHEFAIRLAETFRNDGVIVQWIKMDDAPKLLGRQNVISTLDLEGPYLHDMSEECYNKLRQCFSSTKGGMIWLTRPAQIECVDPRYGLILGLARTIRRELSMDLWTVELQTLDDASIAAVSRVHRNFCRRSTVDRALDEEYSVRDGMIYTGRYHWTRASKGLELPTPGNRAMRLKIGRRGLFQSMRWTEHQIPDTLAPNDVQVNLHYAGLSFTDVMISMGIIPGGDERLGCDGVGIISRVGSNVTNWKTGDRVIVVAARLFTTTIIVSTDRLISIPEHLPLEHVVTMPTVYATVIYALMVIHKLEAGQTILIHSAAGGVGQAAICISQLLGAEIYATVGNEEKIQYLEKAHSIPRERIFSSRDTSFLDGVMRSTAGRGVDLVLNSLSGELLQASWQCVANYGKMIELGKRDMIEHGSIPLDLFQNNRTFHGVDLLDILLNRLDILARVKITLTELLHKNLLKPILPVQIFNSDKVSEAFRLLSNGQQKGKIAIEMPQDWSQTQVEREPEAISLSPTKTYLMIGGLGGIGQAITTWMAERGARNFCFLSRSAGTSETDKGFVRELEFQGCTVAIVAGSVTEVGDVARAIEEAPTPIAGVLQMSMVLKDRFFDHMPHDDWRAVQDPKVKGTWNLHNALCNHDLDFFILLSSVSGSIGNPGQSNYASANTFLDAFVQYRLAQGKPCSAISLGGVEDIGFLSTDSTKLTQVKSMGLSTLKEEDVIDAIQIAIAQSSPSREHIQSQDFEFMCNSQFVVGLTPSNVSNTGNSRGNSLFTQQIRLGLYGNTAKGYGTNVTWSHEIEFVFIKQMLMHPELLNESESEERIFDELGRGLFAFLSLPQEDFHISLSLADLGIDSVGSIEIRNWLRQQLGINVPILEILSSETVEGLGKLVVSHLREKFWPTTSVENRSSDTGDDVPLG